MRSLDLREYFIGQNSIDHANFAGTPIGVNILADVFLCKLVDVRVGTILRNLDDFSS